MAPDVYYPLDEILYLEGNAPSDATVQIQFQKSGAKPITVHTRSNVRGEWVFAGKAPLDAGTWEIRARVIGGADETSPWSNPRLMKAIQTGIVLGGVSITYALLLLVFFGILVASVALIFHFYFRVKRLERRAQQLRVTELEKELRGRTEALEHALLDKDKQEAETEVEKSIADLKTSLVKELEHLEETVLGRPRTKEEQEHKERLMAELSAMQEKIESKIEDIGNMR